MPDLHFGWVVPVEDSSGRGSQPLLLGLEKNSLPAITRRFDSLWVYDHFYGIADPANPYVECWTTLTWLAARCPDVLVGPLVLGVGYRHPPLLARMGATLQALSQGRFVLGIGAGWREEEYLAYGYTFPKASERVEQLEEAVAIIHLLWTEPAPSFEGRYYEIHRAYSSPRPSPRPPIMIGGEGEQLMLPLIGRLADWWNIGPLPRVDDFRRKRDIVWESAQAAGRDPNEILLTHQVMGCKWPRTPADDQAWLDKLGALVELGFSHFMLDCGTFESPELVERFVEQVMAPLRDRA